MDPNGRVNDSYLFVRRRPSSLKPTNHSRLNSSRVTTNILCK